MTKAELLKEVCALDFMLTDIGLYLNTHPHDKVMINKYNLIATQADALRNKYENLYGPLCSYRSYSNENHWYWGSQPWPWEENFNTKTCREGHF